MARIRSVKPELRDSALVASWPFEIRYFWVLFWGYLDDSGRGLDFPKRIAGDCFPHDDIDGKDIDGWLNMMSHGLNDEPGPVCRYQVAGKRYVHCINWHEHQKPNRPTASRLPPCPQHDSLSEPLTEPLSESLNGSSVPGAAEQRSRGAGEQQQRAHESLPPNITTGMLRTVIDATGATETEAEAIVLIVAAEKRHRNLGAFLRRLADDGDLKRHLDDVRTAASKIHRSQLLAAARDGPPCPHQIPGGESPHPDTGEPICGSCRIRSRRTAPSKPEQPTPDGGDP